MSLPSEKELSSPEPETPKGVGVFPHTFEEGGHSPNPFHRAKLAIVGAPTPLGPRKAPKTVGAKKSRMLELTHRLLDSKGEAVVNKVIAVALDDKHPGQMQALRLCLERIAPMSFFEDVHKAQANNTIEIKVSITDPREAVTIDAEVVEVLDEKASV